MIRGTSSRDPTPGAQRRTLFPRSPASTVEVAVVERVPATFTRQLGQGARRGGGVQATTLGAHEESDRRVNRRIIQRYYEMNSVGELPPPAPPGPPVKSRTPLDLHNGDLVSRLLAATPPYLYSMPLAPHSFFFSEMLRSFVQNKEAVSASSSLHRPSAPRRSRKRSWREASYAKPLDKPLELTTTSRGGADEAKLPSPAVLPPAPPLLLPPCGFPPMTPSDPDMLPPPPPVWYPSLYPLSPPPGPPPFGVDPLHFFIDLRVSGHIWDRKNKDAEAAAAAAAATETVTVKQSKHCSAFSLPLARPPEEVDGVERVKSTPSQCGTHYILQNLARIYREAEARRGEARGRASGDLRAVIGLELVVDYMNSEQPPHSAADVNSDDATAPSTVVVKEERDDDVVLAATDSS